VKREEEAGSRRARAVAVRGEGRAADSRHCAEGRAATEEARPERLARSQ
jgi:hypothetical protein